MKPLTHFDRERLIWDSPLPCQEKLFLLALNSFVDGEGKAFPSLQTLADMMGISRRQVIRIQNRLMDPPKNIITTQTRYSASGGTTSNLFQIDFQNLAKWREGGDHQSLGGVTVSHWGGDCESLGGDHQSLGGVTTSHPIYPNRTIQVTVQGKEKERPPRKNQKTEIQEPPDNGLVFPEKEEGSAPPRDISPQHPVAAFDAALRRGSRHPYPELITEGLEAIWLGGKRNNFHPEVIRAATAHLKKHNLPAEKGDAIHYIQNLIRSAQWGKLELLAEAILPKDTSDSAPEELSQDELFERKRQEYLAAKNGNTTTTRPITAAQPVRDRLPLLGVPGHRSDSRSSFSRAVSDLS